MQVLLERRPLDTLQAADGSTRSYTMILYPRGLKALRQLDVELDSTKHMLEGAFILPGLVQQVTGGALNDHKMHSHSTCPSNRLRLQR